MKYPLVHTYRSAFREAVVEIEPVFRGTLMKYPLVHTYQAAFREAMVEIEPVLV